MNYGKKSVSKKRNSLISRTAMMGKRAHVSLIRVLFVSDHNLCGHNLSGMGLSGEL